MVIEKLNVGDRIIYKSLATVSVGIITSFSSDKRVAFIGDNMVLPFEIIRKVGESCTLLDSGKGIIIKP